MHCIQAYPFNRIIYVKGSMDGALFIHSVLLHFVLGVVCLGIAYETHAQPMTMCALHQD